MLSSCPPNKCLGSGEGQGCFSWLFHLCLFTCTGRERGHVVLG